MHLMQAIYSTLVLILSCLGDMYSPTPFTLTNWDSMSAHRAWSWSCWCVPLFLPTKLLPFFVQLEIILMLRLSKCCREGQRPWGCQSKSWLWCDMKRIVAYNWFWSRCGIEVMSKYWSRTFQDTVGKTVSGLSDGAARSAIEALLSCCYNLLMNGLQFNC